MCMPGCLPAWGTCFLGKALYTRTEHLVHSRSWSFPAIRPHDGPLPAASGRLRRILLLCFGPTHPKTDWNTSHQSQVYQSIQHVINDLKPTLPSISSRQPGRRSCFRKDLREPFSQFIRAGCDGCRVEVQAAVASQKQVAIATDSIVTSACERVEKAALRPFHFRLVRFKQCSYRCGKLVHSQRLQFQPAPLHAYLYLHPRRVLSCFLDGCSDFVLLVFPSSFSFPFLSLCSSLAFPHRIETLLALLFAWLHHSVTQFALGLDVNCLACILSYWNWALYNFYVPACISLART